jgi:hypothetical protein
MTPLLLLPLAFAAGDVPGTRPDNRAGRTFYILEHVGGSEGSWRGLLSSSADAAAPANEIAVKNWRAAVSSILALSRPLTPPGRRLAAGPAEGAAGFWQRHPDARALQKPIGPTANAAPP